jgi:hypothetical protein
MDRVNLKTSWSIDKMKKYSHQVTKAQRDFIKILGALVSWWQKNEEET